MRSRTLRILAAALTAALLAVGIPTSPASASDGFGDVPADAFYGAPVQWLVDNGITKGTSRGCFSPKRPVTRGEVATLLWRYAGEPTAPTAGFRDVKAGDFFAEAVAWMAAKGMTTGVTPTLFAPNRPITRGEVATLLWRYSGSPVKGQERFDDVKKGDFFARPVGWMARRGITTGITPRIFAPNRPVTRGEIATFLYRHAGSPRVKEIAGGRCGKVTRPRVPITTTVPTTTANPTSTTARPTTTTARPTSTTTKPTTTTTAKPPTSTTSTTSTTTTMPATTSTTTTSTTTTSTTTTTTTTAPPSGRFETLPVGSTLPSAATCAAQVRSAPEIRPGNTTYNNTVGTEAHPDFPRVDGNFTGTTDEILQWAACKWGIDEDIVRAQVARESWWEQTAGGDLSNDPADCHPSVRHLSPCPESLGILQVRYLYHRDAIDNAITSTAYNADYTYAAIRSCFEGNETWLNTVERGGTYGAGDLWGCLGVWFSGRWRTADALWYIGAVGDYLDERIWEQAYFQ